MRTHTSQFKDGIKQYGRQFTDTIYYNSSTYTGERINSVNYSVDTSLCKSVMQTLKIDTDIPMNIGDTLDYGISIDGVTGSEIRFNNFIVNKIEDQKDKKSKLITCYDNMIKTMQDYESFYDYTTDTTFSNNKNYYELDNGKYKRYTGARTGNPQSLGLYQSMFPTTIKNYIYMICYRLGITFKNLNGSFTNYSKAVIEEHYVDVDGNSLGYTYRDVLDDIAEATGSFICIDNSGKLEVRGFTNTNDTINEEYFNDKNVNIGNLVGPYNVVVLSREDVDNIYYPSTLPANPIEFKISDNPILDQTNRDGYIQGIYDKINNLSFYTNDFATKGILYYEVGDKYNVSIGGTTYNCLMLSDNIKRTQGLVENILTKEPKQSVTEYKYASPTDRLEKQSRNAIIKVDKANASIEQIVSAVGDNGQVTTASIVQSINNSGSQIQLNADKIYINGVTFDQNQTMTMTEGTINIQQSSGDNSIYTYEDNSYDNTRVETSLIPAGTYTDIRNMLNDTITDYGEYYVSGIRLGTDASGDTFFVDGASGDTTIDGELKLKGGWIASGDLNDVDRSRTCWYGVYTPNQSVANVPDYSNEVGFLNVICWGGNPDWCVQEYYVVTGDRVNKYIRSHHWGTSSNDWSNWKPICVDTGWVDLSSNVNSAEGFAVRPDFPVMARKINDVVYWRGMIYSTTAKNYKMANILLNIPSQFCANYEMGRGGIMYDINTKYYMYQESNYIRISQEVDFRADPSWYGYNLSTISGYPQA